jgi:hypothetical protein
MLRRMDLFEPWPLSFDVAGQKIGFDDLLVVRPLAFERGSLAPVIERFGADAASLLACHRLSLFRAGPLLSAARAVPGEPSDSDALMDFRTADPSHVLRPAE